MSCTPQHPPALASSTEVLKGHFTASCQRQPRAALRATDINASPGTGFLHVARTVVCRYAGSVQKLSYGKPVFEGCLDESRQTLHGSA